MSIFDKEQLTPHKIEKQEKFDNIDYMFIGFSIGIIFSNIFYSIHLYLYHNI